VLAVELFVSGGRLLVNELAPRPHNSGHWTLDAAVTSQFAQHVRAVTGAALGSTAATVPAVAMVNLLGELWFTDDAAPAEPDWSEALADPDARVHLYGKAEPRHRRKMGHLTVLGDDIDEVVRRALCLRQSVVETLCPGAGGSGDDGPVQRPPDRIGITDGRLVLRRHRPADIDTLQSVIEASRDHLRPFMPWADQDRVATATFLVKSIEDWERANSFNYLLTEPATRDGGGERLLGACGLHKRGAPGTIEIGYWLRPEATGHGTMTAAAEALTAAAFGLDDVERVEIHCDEANERSAAIPRRLGFRYDGVEIHDASAPGETGRRQVWVRERSCPR
jgi:RimJ/RimL family protein N-acetyltransferase